MYHFSTILGGTKMAKAKDAGVFKMENGLWAYVDFVGAAQLGNPCIFPQGEMAVGAGRGLNGNGRS